MKSLIIIINCFLECFSGQCSSHVIFLDPFFSILLSCKACANSFSLFRYLQIFTEHLLCARYYSSSWEDSSDIYVLSPLHQNVHCIRAGRPGVLRFMGLQRVGHAWATELNWTYMTLQKVPVRLSPFFTRVTNLRRHVLLLVSLLCHFCSLDMLSCSVVSDSRNPMDCSPPGSFVNGDYPGKSTGMGCHVLLQGIFPTQVSCIAGRFFTSWATREALCSLDHFPN